MGSCQKGHRIMTSEPPLCELFWVSPVFAWQLRVPRPFVPASSPGSLRVILWLLFLTSLTRPHWAAGGRSGTCPGPTQEGGRERGLAFWGKDSGHLFTFYSESIS